MLRLNVGGSVGLTRNTTKAVPLPSRNSRAPSASSLSTVIVPVALIPEPAAILSRSAPRLVWLRW